MILVLSDLAARGNSRFFYVFYQRTRFKTDEKKLVLDFLPVHDRERMTNLTSDLRYLSL